MQFISYTEWDQLPDSASALFAKVEKESVFFSQIWLENLVTSALEDGQSVLLACVVERDLVLAILPLVKSSSEHLHALGHLYTSLYSVLLTDNAQQDVLKCLVLGLSQLPVLSLRLDPIAQNDINLQGLQQAMESAGFNCHHHFRFFNWIHRLQGQSFADYMAARPSRVRNTISRKQRKLEREHGYHIRLFTGNNLQQAMADYHAVYNSSWKANELFDCFIEGLTCSFSDQGWLRLAILYIGEKPVAAQVWFVAHGKASIFKLAYDNAWKKYSPGAILTSYLMEHVIDTDKVEEIDFLMGNDAYKQDWMSERRERWGLYCGKPRPPKRRTGRFVDSIKGWLQRQKETSKNGKFVRR